MVSKCLKKSPQKCSKDHRISHRHHRKKSPGKTYSPSVFVSSIHKSIHSCKRRIANIFSKLARIATPIRHKGYRILKRVHLQDQEPQNRIRKVLFPNNCLLPPLISNKRTVFLDLDETLVHSKTDPPPKRFDFVVRPKIDGQFVTFYVLKRPGLDEFLEFLNDKFEVVVFTAGLKEYASLVIDKIDTKGVISHRLYRDSCKEVDGKFVKDLSETSRDLSKVVIVDDNPNAFAFQQENAVQILPFVDDENDKELMGLFDFFQICDWFDDLRFAVKAFSSNLLLN